MFFEEKNYQEEPEETVLDCLLRHQVDIDFSCKSGNCQSCLLKLLEGDVNSVAQNGLKKTQIKEGFFFACQQEATATIKAELVDASLIFTRATLVEKHFYSSNICRLIIEPVNPLYYHAGQFVNLRNPFGVARSYSIASLPTEDQFIEVHVHRKNQGEMTSWIFDCFNEGDNIDFQGPIGQCFYTSDTGENPIILIGTGTGAAPLLGILRDALRSNHKGKIIFYHGAGKPENLYLDYLLRALQRHHKNFFYVPCLTSLDACKKNVTTGYCNDIALQQLEVTEDTSLYICGNPEMVKQTRKKAFLAGIASNNIYVDPFDYKDLRKNPR